MSAPLTRCVIDGRCRGKHAVLARLARDLRFPAHFGFNLDALHDVLTTDIRGPLEIVWRGAILARLTTDPELAAVMATLQDVARERPDVSVRIEA